MLSKRDTYLYNFILKKGVLEKKQLQRALQIYRNARQSGLKVNFGFVLHNSGYLPPPLVKKLYGAVDSIIKKEEAYTAGPATQVGANEEPPSKTPPSDSQAPTQSPPHSHEGTMIEAENLSQLFEDEEDPLQKGDQLGDYEIARELGKGGMGVVYEAIQHPLGRRVALKVLAQNLSVNKEAIERFWREVRAVARLQHPNIVQVYSAHKHEGIYFFAMELIEGLALDELMDREKVSIPRALKLMIQACEAMEYSHQEGIIHRDIKPSNMLVTSEDKLLITDFGLVREVVPEGEQLTMSGAVLGTPAYMSPEQTLGERHKIDHHTDIYSLGVTLFELLSGRVPFQGQSSQHVLFQIISDEVPSPRKFAPQLPRDLETITLKAMRKDKSRRYSSARALAEDLKRFQRGEPIHARPIPWWEKALYRVKKHKASLTVVLSVLLLLGTWLMYEAAFKAQKKKASQLREDREKATEKAEREKAKKKILNAISLALSLADESPEKARQALIELEDLESKWKEKSSLFGKEESRIQLLKIHKGLIRARENVAQNLESRARKIWEEGKIDEFKKIKSRARKNWKKAEFHCRKVLEITEGQGLGLKEEEILATRGEYLFLGAGFLARQERWKGARQWFQRAFESEKRRLLLHLKKERKGYLRRPLTSRDYYRILEKIETLKEEYFPQLTKREKRAIEDFANFLEPGMINERHWKVRRALKEKKYKEAFESIDRALKNWGKYKTSQRRELWGHFYFLRAKARLLKEELYQPTRASEIANFYEEKKAEAIRASFKDLNRALSRHSFLVEANFWRGLLLYHYPYPGEFKGSLFNLATARRDLLRAVRFLPEKTLRQRASYYALRAYGSTIHLFLRHLRDLQVSFWNLAERFGFQFRHKGLIRDLNLIFLGSQKGVKENRSHLKIWNRILDERGGSNFFSLLYSLLAQIGNFKSNRNLLKGATRRAVATLKSKLEAYTEGIHFKKPLWGPLQLALKGDFNHLGHFLYRGDYHRSRGEWDRARRAYKEAQKIAPSSVRAKYGLWQTNLITGELGPLREKISRPDQDESRSLPLLYTLAKGAEKMNRDDRARELYYHAFRYEYRPDESLPRRAYLYYQGGWSSLTRAQKLSISFRQVLNPRDRNWVHHIWQGEDYFSRSIEEGASSALIYSYRGLIALGLNRWNQSEGDFERALALNPYLLRAYAFQGLIKGFFYRPANSQAALAHFERGKEKVKEILNHWPSHKEEKKILARECLAFLFYYRFYLEEGWGFLSEKSDLARKSHGRDFRELCQKLSPHLDDEGQKSLQAILHRWHHPKFQGRPVDFPYFLDSLYFSYMGRKLRLMGRFEEAICAYTFARKHDPSQAYNYFYLGQLYYKWRPFPPHKPRPEIIFNYSRALELEPRYGNLIFKKMRNLRKFLALVPNVLDSRVLPLIVKFKKDFPQEPSGNFLHAFYYYLKRDLKGVRKHVGLAVKVEEKMKVLGYALEGRLLAEEKKYEKAKSRLKSSLMAFQKYYRPRRGEVFGLSALWLASVYTAQNKTDRALDWLEKAAASGIPKKEAIANNGEFKSLRGHPRFQRLLR